MTSITVPSRYSTTPQISSLNSSGAARSVYEAVDMVRAEGLKVGFFRPITHTAIGTCGKSLFANIVALGAVNALTHCVSEEALEKAVLNRVPKGTEEANKKALQAGKDLIVTNKE